MPDEPDTRALLGIPCRAEPDLWHSDKPDEIAAAVEACGHCPVLNWCRATQLSRETSLRQSHQWGTWAGRYLGPVYVPARCPDEPRQGTHLHLVPPCSERLTSLPEHRSQP